MMSIRLCRTKQKGVRASQRIHRMTTKRIKIYVLLQIPIKKVSAGEDLVNTRYMTTQPVNNKTAVVSVDPKPSRAYSAPPRLSIDPADVIRSLPSPDTPLPFTESPVEPVIASLDNTFPAQVLADHHDKLPVVDAPAVHPVAQDPVIAIQSTVNQEPATPTTDTSVVDSVESAPVSQPLVLDSLPDVPHTPETLYPSELAEESIPSPIEASTGLTTPIAESPLFEDTPPSTLPEEAFVKEAEQLSEPEPLVAQEPVSTTEVEQRPVTPVVKEAPLAQEVSAVLDEVKDVSVEPVLDSITDIKLDEPTQEPPIPPADISTSIDVVSATSEPEAPRNEPVAPEPTPVIEEAHPIKPSPTSSSRLPILRSNSTPMTPDKRRTSKIPAARPTMSFSLKTASKVDLKAKPAESKLKSQPSTPLPSRAIPRPESPRPSSPRPSPRSPIKSASSNVLSSPRPRPVSRMREADVPMAKKTGKKKEDEDEDDKPPARLTVQEKRRREAMRAQQIKLWRHSYSPSTSTCRQV
ncbi:hypothetical protein BJV82DRAFT_573597 [Fennellomyces sp. T-0311]|nr:hypothetical protein BJV82DRAFT_573597 [Fennellomyces sp. T-0311]